MPNLRTAACGGGVRSVFALGSMRLNQIGSLVARIFPGWESDSKNMRPRRSLAGWWLLMASVIHRASWREVVLAIPYDYFVIESGVRDRPVAPGNLPFGKVPTPETMTEGMHDE